MVSSVQGGDGEPQGEGGGGGRRGAGGQSAVRPGSGTPPYGRSSFKGGADGGERPPVEASSVISTGWRSSSLPGVTMMVMMMMMVVMMMTMIMMILHGFVCVCLCVSMVCV